MPNSVCWTSYADPESLVTVGPNVVAVLCQNIVFFYNVKTRAKNSYKGDSPECAGISLLAGHPQYPLFAIAEAVLRPSIYVMNYPEMEKLTHIPPTNDLYYVDLHLSEYLIALSGHPENMLKSWNYRTGSLNAVEKLKKYEKHCMHPMCVIKTPIVLYSIYDRDIAVLETCFVNDTHVFHEITNIKMGKDYEKSTKFNVAWLSEDPYVVNDYGVVSMVSYGTFTFIHEWKAPQTGAEPRAYRIFHRSTTSLLVVNETTVYCIKKQTSCWFIEWQIENMTTPIIKMVTDFFGNIYATTDFGNIYYVHYSENIGSLKELDARKCKVQSYCFLTGINVEVVLLLTADGELRLVDLLFMNTLSSIYIEDACCMESHNNTAFIAVGTSKGTVHFVSYEKHRKPVKLGSLDIGNLSIAHLKLFDNIAFVVDEENGIDILICDYQNMDFQIGFSLEREENPKLEVNKIFLLDCDRAVLFVSHERKKLPILAECMWLIHWHSTNTSIIQRELKLPHKYRDFTLISSYNNEKVKFMCPRVNSFIIDMLLVKKNDQLIIDYSICNPNYGYFNRISGTGNIIASSATGISLHFQSHELSKVPYKISRSILTSYVPYLRKLMDVCFNLKFLLVLYSEGHLMVFQLPILKNSFSENEYLENVDLKSITAYQEKHRNIKSEMIVIVRELTQKDIKEKNSILIELESIREAMCKLIDDDISETGRTHGSFRKFCVNEAWIACLTANAKMLCKNEASQMLRAVEDQRRIRNWILNLIKSSKSYLSTKLHALFSNTYLENYATSPIVKKLHTRFDNFLMNDFELDESSLEILADRKSIAEMNCDEGKKSIVKPANHFKFEKGQDVFEYIMSNAFDIQDINIVSNYQMYNEESKLQIILINALKEEFNKKFGDVKNKKHEIVDYISKANAEMETIYSNMNCMLRLLNMNEYKPPELLYPEWKRDEFIERIITVDDSEITAVNPRRIVLKKTSSKRSRMLLWSDEFFSRAIMTMMDGVLEKLWEEEIKKTPKPPEFVKIKSPEELAGEEAHQFKAYEQTLVKLEQDRRKYLQILKDCESKTLCRKNQQISKLNHIVAEMVLLKLHYDFAINRERLRLFNTKKNHFERIQCKRRIYQQRERLDMFNSYNSKYGKLLEYWGHTIFDLKTKFDSQTQRDRQLERQFKMTYITSIPAHLCYEMNKIYKRRPKLPVKSLSSASVSNDVHERILSKKQFKFPLQDELNEFLALLDSIDDIQNCPYQLEQRYWEQFVKLRRQRLESELRLKSTGSSIVDAQLYSNSFTTSLNVLKQSQADLMSSIAVSVETYFDIAHNRDVVVTLSMGQLETGILKREDKIILVLNVDDIDMINNMIKEAGKRKTAAMQRVAFFRRQVIYKEWEHQVMRANIEYLKYVLKLVQNCKIPFELLEVCRNWHMVEENKNSSELEAIEKELVKKKKESDKKMKSIDQKVEKVRAKLRAIRASNNALDRKIDCMKFDVAVLNHRINPLKGEKVENDRKQRFAKFLKHYKMVDTVRRDYVQILELTTILELQRLRTYPTLGPAPQCVLRDQ